MNLRTGRLVPLALALILAACGGEAAGSGGASLTGVSTAVPERTPAFAVTATPSPMPTPPPAPRSAVVAFVGDVMLDREVELAMQEDPGYPFAAARPLFAGVDIVVANLEGTFTDVGVPLDKFYQFATDPSLARGLRALPVWGVSLSNNHATDYGLVGLERTLQTLDELGIVRFGAGMTEAEARQGVIASSGASPVIAFLGYSDIGETIFASGDQGGVARASVEAITEDVRAMRARRPAVDFVVVTIHAGTEYTHEVGPRQQELARAAVEAGADLVVGHHPHVLQPVEEYHAADGRIGLILYSLGNFVFDLDADDLVTLGEGPFQSVVAAITFVEGRPPILQLRPAYIDVAENRPRPATPEEGEAILRLLVPSGQPAVAP